MFNFLKSFLEDNRIATIKTLENDRFGLFNRDDTLIKTYSRRRDAVRGAERLGLTIG